MAKGIVIYGFPAIGKTTVCKKYENFLDLESSDYQWSFTDEQLKMGVEERKGVDKVKNPNLPQNYYNAIDKARKKYDYVFVAFAGIEHCQKENIPYMRIFPTVDQKDEYIKRMRKRGNAEAFLEKMYSNFENFVNGCKDDQKSINIEMRSGEYLEDCLKRIKIIDTNKEELIG